MYRVVAEVYYTSNIFQNQIKPNIFLTFFCISPVASRTKVSHPHVIRIFFPYKSFTSPCNPCRAKDLQNFSPLTKGAVCHMSNAPKVKVVMRP